MEQTVRARVLFLLQGLWFDDGDDMSDTRSGAIMYDPKWRNTPIAAGEAFSSSSAVLIRDATSAQVDLTTLLTNNIHWYRGAPSGTRWGDPNRTTGATCRSAPIPTWQSRSFRCSDPLFCSRCSVALRMSQRTSMHRTTPMVARLLALAMQQS